MEQRFMDGHPLGYSITCRVSYALHEKQMVIGTSVEIQKDILKTFEEKKS